MQMTLTQLRGSLAPRHRADSRPDGPSTATCNCATGPWSVCPRHNAEAYADHMAQHATDSIAPRYFR